MFLFSAFFQPHAQGVYPSLVIGEIISSFKDSMFFGFVNPQFSFPILFFHGGKD
jgi:hypothetical protein